jgi:FtsZ-interacting cell division protein ZipA
MKLKTIILVIVMILIAIVMYRGWKNRVNRLNFKR